MMTTRPNIFEYLNYRQYLRDLFQFKKSEKASAFSFRTFSRLAGLKSSNFLKLVMDGKRNVSGEAIHKFAKAFKLTKEETHFFESLVQFEQAANAEEKNFYYDRILKSKSYNDVRLLEAHQYTYFSNWHFVAIRELVTLKGFQEDPVWINKRLGTKLHAEEVKKAIHILLTLGLLKRDEKGRLSQTVEKITTSPEMGMLALINFHREMLRKASESLEKHWSSQRDISALTVSVSKKQYDKIRERLNQVRREIHAMTEEGDNKEVIYQINLQLFPLSEVVWES